MTNGRWFVNSSNTTTQHTAQLWGVRFEDDENWKDYCNNCRISQPQELITAQTLERFRSLFTRPYDLPCVQNQKV